MLNLRALVTFWLYPCPTSCHRHSSGCLLYFCLIKGAAPHLPAPPLDSNKRKPAKHHILGLKMATQEGYLVQLPRTACVHL